MKSYDEYINENESFNEKYKGFDSFLKENVLYERYGLKDGNESIGGYFTLSYKMQYTIDVWFPDSIERGDERDYNDYLENVQKALDRLKRIKEDFGAYRYWAHNNSKFVFEIKEEDFENSFIVKEYFNIFKSQKGIDKYNL